VWCLNVGGNGCCPNLEMLLPHLLGEELFVIVDQGRYRGFLLSPLYARVEGSLASLFGLEVLLVCRLE